MEKSIDTFETPYGVYRIFENIEVKVLRSENYNWNFNKKTGFFQRWGKTQQDDPQYSPFGPEILDLECCTSCPGVTGNGPNGEKMPCRHCYKGNTPKGTYMSFETFKEVFYRFPRVLTQLAFGSSSDLSGNPDFWKIVDYCRNNSYQEIIPNVTVAEISDDTADLLAKYMGAVAVSRYDDKNVCYDTIYKLTSRNMTQINMHYCIHDENYEQVMETIKDIQTDKRLKKLNAIVFLSLKQKGRGTNFKKMSNDKFKNIVNYCLDNQISWGMDSCSASKCIEVAKDRMDNNILSMIEPCEAYSMSSYVDVNGFTFPCSFCNNTLYWENGIHVPSCSDFLKDIWYNERVVGWRNNLLNIGRKCPIYDI